MTPGAAWGPPPPRPRLSSDAVHVWRARCDLARPRLGDLERTLGADERRRAERFRFDRDRERFIIARGLLRVVLGLYLELDPAAVRFFYRPHGRPEIAAECGPDALRFNASHSHELDLLALTAGRAIGVDVEYVRHDMDHESIARDFFARAEVTALAALPGAARAEAFFACWTRKEAYVKARGEGLSLPLDEFHVSLAPGEPAALLGVAGDPEAAARWSLRQLDPGPGYTAALAVEGPISQMSFWQWPA